MVHFEEARWLLEAVPRLLRGRAGEGVDEVLFRLADQRAERADFTAIAPATIPVTRFLAETTARTMLVDPLFAAALAGVSDGLRWQQSNAYTDEILGHGFCANYGWAEVIGRDGFFAGDDFRLGFFLLGPNRHYLGHHHPAPELYLPLTGPSEWQQGKGEFVTKAAGEAIWHAPHVVHATKTGLEPLLALWCWTRDTETPARLVAA